MDARSMVAVAALMLAGVGSGTILRSAWSARGAAHGRVAAGWAVVAGAIAVAMVMRGPALGLAIAATTLPLGVLIVVGRGAVRRNVRAPRGGERAPEPLQGRSRWWRGAVRFVLAGPLGMLAAMGVAFCYASWAPGAVATRLLIAALLVPLLWGLAMTWTLADQRLLRAAGVLAATIAAGFGLALLGGIA
ncbi:MAG: hypothetical protein PGN08_04980 [Sphingomonas taxi]